MAFRKKAQFIMHYQPDIAIISECEHPDKLKFNSETLIPNDIFWYGHNKNKGVGIFSYNKYKFQLFDIHNPEFKIILPLEVTNGDIDFTLFAIWANNPQDLRFQYVGQIWKAIHYYDILLQDEKIILAGDFNSSSIWDLPRRECNHSNVVSLLAQKGIHSTYHKYYNQEQGKETQPTLFMYRHEDKAYHIDYCFASTFLINRLQGLEVGSYKAWKQFSDHMPLIINFDLTL